MHTRFARDPSRGLLWRVSRDHSWRIESRTSENTSVETVRLNYECKPVADQKFFTKGMKFRNDPGFPFRGPVPRSMARIRVFFLICLRTVDRLDIQIGCQILNTREIHPSRSVGLSKICYDAYERRNDQCRCHECHGHECHCTEIPHAMRVRIDQGRSQIMRFRGF